VAKPRVIVKRRKSVRNIRKITRTMQLIATARFQAAVNRASATRPYTQKLAELVGDLSRVVTDVRHPLMEAHADVKRSAVVAITSNRGFCGGYNTNVLRMAIAHGDENQQGGVESDVYMVGKKGVRYFRFLRRPMKEQITHIGDKPTFAHVEEIANGLMDRFIRREVAAVYVAYMRFVSAGKQVPTLMQLLPIAPESQQDAPGASEAGHAASAPSSVEYEFSPAPQELLAELLPTTVRARLFQCFIEAAASEQIARMAAMKAATEAAGDMIKALTRQYNRARQTQITMELLDIVGGANALE
jgi:F-type H+-transporting ATPase subunit gamma